MRLSVLDVLGEAWLLYTKNLARFIGLAGIVYLVLSLVLAIVAGSQNRALAPVLIVVTIVGIVWLQGAIVVAIEDIRGSGGALTLTQIFARVEPRIWTLLAVGILVGVVGGVLLTFGIAFLLPGAILIGAAIYVLARWSLVTPLVVVERHGVRASLRRSWDLTRDNFLPIFGVILISALVTLPIQAVVRGALIPIPGFLYVFLSNLIANSITFPFIAVAWALMYYDLRSIEKTRSEM